MRLCFPGSGKPEPHPIFKLLSVFLDTSSAILQDIGRKNLPRTARIGQAEVRNMNTRNYRDLGKRIVEAAGVVLVLLTVSAAESIANFILM